MPTAEEIAIIKENADTPDGLFFYFLLYTGLRRGEALALQWKDIDEEAGIIHVWRSLYYAGKTMGISRSLKQKRGSVM